MTGTMSIGERGAMHFRAFIPRNKKPSGSMVLLPDGVLRYVSRR